jgi:hypothetical protein
MEGGRRWGPLCGVCWEAGIGRQGPASFQEVGEQQQGPWHCPPTQLRRGCSWPAVCWGDCPCALTGATRPDPPPPPLRSPPPPTPIPHPPQDVEEAELSVEEAKERKIMKLLLKARGKTRVD